MAGVEQPSTLVLLVAVAVGLHLSVLAKNTATDAATAVADSELTTSQAEPGNYLAGAGITITMYDVDDE